MSGTATTGQVYEVLIGQNGLAEDIALLDCKVSILNEDGTAVYAKEADAVATVSTVVPVLSHVGDGHYTLSFIPNTPETGSGTWTWWIWSDSGIEAHDTVIVSAATVAAEQEAVPVITDPVVRRVRRIVGEYRTAIVFTDTEIKYAYADVLEDKVNGDLGTTHVVTYSEDGTEITGVTTSAGAEITGPEYRALALATAIDLITGLVSELSRDAISTDSPRGRLNTTVAPGELRKFLEGLQEDYDKAVFDIAGVESEIGISFADLSGMMTTRGYPEEV